MNGLSSQGSTAADTLLNLHRLYCGCKFITRSVSINFTYGTNQIFREEDFNFFYHLQEIRNVLFLKNVNTVPGSRIILPNLRIIRGEAAIYLNNGDRMAVIIHNVNALQLILPRLTEISQGGVFIYRSPQLQSNLMGVLWSDIIDYKKYSVNINNANGKQKGALFIMLFKCFVT